MRSGRNADSGWAWVVLAVSVFNMYVLGTLVISVGMFQDRFLQHYGGSTAYISLVCSFFISLQCILGPLASVICNMFSIRTSVMLGGRILSVGLVASSITNTLPQLLGCFGILSGIGFGIIYTPATIAVGYYFEEKRVLAHGIATSFTGIGVLSGPHVVGWLIDKFGWRMAMSTLGCVTAQMVVTGSLIFPHKRSKQSASVAVGKNVSAFTLLKDKVLPIILLNYFTSMMSYSIQLVHLPSYARSVGVPPANVPSLFTAYGLTLTVARIWIWISLLIISITGALYDMTSSYAAGFHIGGSVSLLGTMLLFLIPILKRKAKIPGDPEDREFVDPS